jgi:5-methylthioadenosine/S-adenosylhomocysteine deaminase
LTVDILVKNAFVLTMKGEGVGMIEDGAVAIEGNEIVAVGKTHQVESEVGKGDRVFDARKKAVLPGFVDGHIHTGGTLLRGECQDVPEIEWMLKTVAPFSPHQTRELRLKGSRLGVLEALKSGTTCFGELSGDASFLAEELYSKIGVRANLGSVVNEIGPGSRRSAYEPYQLFSDIGERKLKENLNLIDRWGGGADGRISCVLGPHALDMLSEDMLMRMKEIAEERNLVMHMHVAQGGRESIQIKLRYGTTSTVNVLD